LQVAQIVNDEWCGVAFAFEPVEGDPEDLVPVGHAVAGVHVLFRLEPVVLKSFELDFYIMRLDCVRIEYAEHENVTRFPAEDQSIHV